MSHRIPSLTAFLATAALAGAALAGPAIQGRGSFAGAFTTTPRGGGLADLEIRANGIVSHLGRSTVRITGAADFNAAVPTPLPPTDGIVTAANGDQVRFRILWTLHPVSPGVFDVTGPYSVTGGTGRFRNAGGEGFCTGRVDLNTRAAAANIAGSVVRRR